MDDEARKMLTEWLGECWHECEFVDSCCKCGMWFPSNRPFTSPDDFFAVKNRLVELGLWGIFWWESNRIYEQESPGGGTLSGHANWLLDPKLFCDLVAKFLEVNDGY